MPIGMLRAYLTMLPRLRAEAQFDALQGAIVARSMRIDASDARRWAGDLERKAQGIATAPRAAPATPEALAAMGIAVVMENAPEPAHV